MEIKGRLLKMRVVNDNPVKYWLPVGDQEIFLNDLLNKNISIEFNKEIRCILCGRKTSKSFFQGMCYPCFMKSPEAEECVLKPELCRAHQGIARDMEYAKEHCLQEHFVYLSFTGDLKVGVTRKTQIPVRWIDQGAIAALKIASTPNRHTAGIIEVMLKRYISDKTNWRLMLKNNSVDKDLLLEKKKILTKLDQNIKRYFIDKEKIVYIKYPVITYPENAKSITFEKESIIKGTLTGIKGQYLIFKNNKVVNIRKHAGYVVTLRI